jgi:hypothetical protein
LTVADATIASLGKLLARAALLHSANQFDAAVELSTRAANELDELSDEDVRVAFGTVLGFYSAAVFFDGSAEARDGLKDLQATAQNGDVAAMRDAVSTIIKDIQDA